MDHEPSAPDQQAPTAAEGPTERSILVGPSHEWWHRKKLKQELPPDLNVVPKLTDFMPKRDGLGVIPVHEEESKRYKKQHWPSNPL